MTPPRTPTTHRKRRAAGAAAALAVALPLALAAVPAGAAPRTPAPPAPLLPVVFVHGNSGSAQQFSSQFQRFASNGYPQDLLFAYEYDTSGSSNVLAVAELGPFIDRVLAQTGASQVLLAAHSRGTTVSHAYLADPAQAAEVAKYVNLDGRSSATEPGGVETLAVWGEWQSPPSPTRGTVGAIGGAENLYSRDQGHTETASSARTFAAMWDFFLGRAPATTDVVPEPPGQVTVAGRAVLFPQNAGFAGATLEVHALDAATGQRTGGPLLVQALDETGAFGPLRVNGRTAYEFAVLRPGGTVHHFYASPFSRDDHFVRLNTAPEGTGLELFTARDPRHTSVTVTRQRELWGDQGAGSDVLTVDLLGDAVPPVGVLTPATAPRTGPAGQATGEVNAMFLFDVGPRGTGGTPFYAPSDQRTDLSQGDLLPFRTLTFLNAADVFLPASPDASGTLRFAMTPRGGTLTEVVNVPNWPSPTDRVTVLLNDRTQDDESHPYRRPR